MFMSCPVPSWAVTEAQLAAWGFTLEATDKCVGSKVIVRAGMTRGQAVHAAWARGFVRIAVRPEWLRQRDLAAFHARHETDRQRAAETLAHLRAHGLIVEGHGRATIAAAAAA